MKKILIALFLIIGLQAVAFAHHHVHWRNSGHGSRLPSDKVSGGYVHGRTVYVCRAGFRGEIHPGYVMNGRCRIVVNGRGYSVDNYKILTGHGFSWHDGKNGHVPSHAIDGGSSRGRRLYVCKANYKMSTYTGELNGTTCNFAYEGDEKQKSHYRILINK